MFDYLIADIYYPDHGYHGYHQVVTRGPAGGWRQTNITQISISPGNEHCSTPDLIIWSQMNQI